LRSAFWETVFSFIAATASRNAARGADGQVVGAVDVCYLVM
jgi:hypothetical protein